MNQPRPVGLQERDALVRGKRLFDLTTALAAFLLSSPLFVAAIVAVWLYDRRNPFFVSERVGLHGRPMRFLKIRTMTPGANSNAVDTTVQGDPRVTPVGRWIRAVKLDELPQLLHVIAGSMSLVGPRPNVAREVALYTHEERRLLTVAPGVTDFASIVFADLASALANAADANIAYNQLVRPWKSRLGLHYVDHGSVAVDIRLVFYTVTALVARQWTLRRLSDLLRSTRAPEDLCRFVLRDAPLTPLPPPGADSIVTSRTV